MSSVGKGLKRNLNSFFVHVRGSDPNSRQDTTVLFSNSIYSENRKSLFSVYS